MSLVVMSTLLEVSLEGPVINFDSRFDHGVKSFGAIPSCDFVFDMLLEALVKLGRKSFVVPVGSSRILLEVCCVSDGRSSLLEVLDDSFGGSAWVNVSEDFGDFFFKVRKGFEDLPGHWFLGFGIDGILEVVVEMRFDPIESCSGQ